MSSFSSSAGSRTFWMERIDLAGTVLLCHSLRWPILGQRALPELGVHIERNWMKEKEQHTEVSLQHLNKGTSECFLINAVVNSCVFSLKFEGI